MKLNELLKYNDIIIQCHNFPDADAVASGFGVYRYLCLNGKNPRLVYSGPQKISKPNMLFMTEKLEIPIEYAEELGYEPELLITVDCIYGESNVKKFNAQNIAVIDHHICSNSEQLPAMSEIRSNYGSCSTVVAKMLEAEGVDINSEISLSTALYYGLFMDTNGFAEVGHPADKDVRDFCVFDQQLITILRNSNLTHQEMEIAGEALNHCSYDSDYHMSVVEARPCDPNILGFIGDLLIQVSTVDHCIVYCRINSGYKLSARSCTYKINASEFVRYITDGVGSGGGHSSKAGGFISGASLGDRNITEFIPSRMVSYHKETDIIYSADGIKDISDMECYQKRRVVLGYVPSAEIADEGTEMLVRMLEGDITIRADKNVYLMIGISGEVYPISKDVFEATYELSDKLPEADYEYSPSVIDRDSGHVNSLEPYIKGCISVSEAVVRAKQLERRVKIFTEWDKNNYLSGAVGDYLVVKENNLNDVYIIKNKLFDRLYKSV